MNNLICHNSALIVGANGDVGNAFVQRIAFVGGNQRFQNFAGGASTCNSGRFITRFCCVRAGYFSMMVVSGRPRRHAAERRLRVSHAILQSHRRLPAQYPVFRQFVDNFSSRLRKPSSLQHRVAHISSGSFLNLLIRIVKFHIELLS